MTPIIHYPKGVTMPKKETKRELNDRYVGVTLSETLLAEVRAAAKAEGRTMSSFIRYCIIRAISEGAQNGNA